MFLVEGFCGGGRGDSVFDMSPLSLEDIQCEGTGTDQECTGDQTLSCAHQTCQNVKIEIVFIIAVILPTTLLPTILPKCQSQITDKRSHSIVYCDTNLYLQIVNEVLLCKITTNMV